MMWNKSEETPVISTLIGLSTVCYQKRLCSVRHSCPIDIPVTSGSQWAHKVRWCFVLFYVLGTGVFCRQQEHWGMRGDEWKLCCYAVTTWVVLWCLPGGGVWGMQWSFTGTLDNHSSSFRRSQGTARAGLFLRQWSKHAGNEAGAQHGCVCTPTHISPAVLSLIILNKHSKKVHYVIMQKIIPPRDWERHLLTGFRPNHDVLEGSSSLINTLFSKWHQRCIILEWLGQHCFYSHFWPTHTR
jgi:hypothetical protein